MLWLGLMARDTGTTPSSHLKIEDEVTALDFNLAVSLRLLQFDNEKDMANKRFWAQLLGGEPADDVLDATHLHPLVRNDPYADENTILS